jgi:hypothetical protein
MSVILHKLFHSLDEFISLLWVSRSWCLISAQWTLPGGMPGRWCLLPSLFSLFGSTPWRIIVGRVGGGECSGQPEWRPGWAKLEISWHFTQVGGWHGLSTTARRMWVWLGLGDVVGTKASFLYFVFEFVLFILFIYWVMFWSY